jgi:hypothetical protein
VRAWTTAGALALALGAAGPALAAGEEIQVYMDEISPKGHFGLDVHVNYVADGVKTFDYAGQQQSLHRVRITPEWSWAVGDTLELGAYLPLATISDGDFKVDGAKLRLKFVAPRPENSDWFWGANFEIGKVAERIDINPWNAEAKGIIGARKGPWTMALNTNFGWVVDGPDKGDGVGLEIATKLSYAIAPDFAIGVESYNDVGEVSHLGGDLTRLEHSTYVTFDRSFGDWELNFGVGKGYGDANPDEWIVKAIIGIPIDRRK